MKESVTDVKNAHIGIPLSRTQQKGYLQIQGDH